VYSGPENYNSLPSFQISRIDSLQDSPAPLKLLMLRAIESYHHYYYYYFIINVFSIFIITIIIIIITVIGPVVCMSFCLSVCLSVGLLQKWWANFVETWNCDWVYQLEELINLWWWSGLGYEFRITFPLPLLCRIGHFRSFISISHTDWCRQGKESTTSRQQSCGSVSGSIQIHIQIANQFWPSFQWHDWQWQRYAASKHVLLLLLSS